MDRETEGKKSEREKGRERTKEYSRFARLIEKRANDASLFLARACFSRRHVFSFPPRRGAPPRESHPPRALGEPPTAEY